MKGISVIICCYNSAARLPKTLTYLKQQSQIENIACELIIVDNASTDNTAEVAKEIWQNNNPSPIPLQVLYEKNAGLANARKCGLQAANYDYVCMVDDDNWLIDNYLETVYNIFETYPNVGACGGWGEETFEIGVTKPFWYDSFKNGYAVGKMAETEKILTHEKEFLFGAGLAIRLEIWHKLQAIGFESMLLGRTADKVTSGEDVEMGYMIKMLGYELFFSPKLYFQHLMASNRLMWTYLKKLKRGFGSSAIYHGFYKNKLYPNTWRTFIRNFWATEFLLTLLITIAKVVLFFPFIINDTEGNRYAASWQHSIGRLTELWQLRTQYKTLNQRIKNLV
jgi:glycosyltransferase involved in cell wall biosynthesis